MKPLNQMFENKFQIWWVFEPLKTISNDRVQSNLFQRNNQIDERGEGIRDVFRILSNIYGGAIFRKYPVFSLFNR